MDGVEWVLWCVSVKNRLKIYLSLVSRVLQFWVALGRP
jgi:hypothetical protein